MRKIREVLRLKFELGLSERQIATSCRMGKTTVGEYLHRARNAELGWPLPEGMDDPALDALLFPEPEVDPNMAAGGHKHPLPDWEYIQQELGRNKGMTLLLLWREYQSQHQGGYCYSTFTVKFREWKQGHKVRMRLDHKPGEKLFVDYAGMTLPITDPQTGEAHPAAVFVAVLGASSYTYCEVTQTQGLADWLGSHRRALEFLGGVPQIIVPDNTKTGVKSPCYYEPELNPSYAEFAAHYGVAVIPARVRKPRDKAKVETGVQIVERQILAPLRNRTFFSLQEANQAVWELLEELNARAFQKLLGSRKSLFEEVDKPNLGPLPLEPYVLAEWKKAKVNVDYHIEVEGHYYSVPYRYAQKHVELRLTHNTVEIYYEGQRIASHRRVPDLLSYRGRHTTVSQHMPKAHQRYGDWSPQRLIHWAQKTGEHTARVVEEILASRPHPEQGYRSCMGLIRLGETFGVERLETACRRACYYRAFSFKSVQSILQNNLDSQPWEVGSDPDATSPILHPNVRGAGYYNGK